MRKPKLPQLQKRLGVNMTVNICDSGFGKYFSATTPKAQARKEKIDKLDFIII